MRYVESPAGRPEETFDVASVRLQPGYGEVGDHSSGGICFEPRVWTQDNHSQMQDEETDGPDPIAGALADPDSMYGKRIGEEALARERGEKPDDIGKDPGDSAERAAIFFSLESPMEKDPPTDPELTREIEIKPPTDQKKRSYGPWCLGHQAGSPIREIARATGWSVLLESFSPLNDMSALLVYGKQPLYKVFIALEKTGYTWKRSGSVLLIRPSDSLLRRAREISDALIADYRQRYERQGGYSLGDMAELVSSLTDIQIVESLYPTGLMGYDSQILVKDSGSREALRFYHSLSSLQKSVLASSSGIPLSQLSSREWQRIRKAVPSHVQDADLTGAAIRLMTTKGGAYAFIVEIAHEEYGKPRELWSCHLDLPAHNSPPDEEEWQ